jgi:alpha-L-fucosidase
MKNTVKKILFSLFVITLSTIVIAQENSEMDKMWGDKKVSVDALKNGRGKFFDESNFGMFIHWGLFSNLGGVWDNKTYYGIGEWIMNGRMAGIPVNEYKKIANDFNPSEFDAKAFVHLAKAAGMKYIIITSKHHEGFAMFHSKVDNFNVVDATPFGRDPMKELAVACKENGLGFGFYYSHNQDWTAPGGTRGPKTYSDGKEATFSDYFYKKCKPQVKEICSNYGDLDFVWFDTPGEMPKEHVVELVEMVRELQPNAMLCSRVGHGMGDYSSEGDMEVPLKNIKGLWETCDTNNDSWSYAWYDNNFKSPKNILHRLISTVGRGGSYLFNVGPNQKGVVPEIGAQFLRETGDWIAKYPQVVYKAGSSPWQQALPWGDITTQGNTLHLSVFDWPRDGKLYLPGLDNKIISAKLLFGKKKKKLKFSNENGWTVINVPFEPAEELVSVIELVLEDENPEVNTVTGIYPNIPTQLLADFAEVSNAERKYIRWMEKFGEWKHATQVSEWQENGKVEWEINVCEAGIYYIDLSYKGKGKLVWKTETDEGVVVQNQQAATEKYVYYPMGILEFKTAGIHKISVSLVEGDPKTSSLKSILIKPINN